MVTDTGTLSPEQMLQQQQNLRNLKMSEMLVQQGMQQPQGQMVSGRYVPPSIFQNIAGLANTYVGQQGIEKAEQANLNLAKQLREQGVLDTQRLMNTFVGRPAIAGTPDVPTETYETVRGTPAQAATAPNPRLAFAEAINMTSPQARALLPQIAAEAFKQPKYKEVTQYNEKTGNTENYRYNENSPDPKSTLQFIGISKPALSMSDRITFGDKGIPIPSNLGSPAGGNMPVSNAPVAGNAPVTSQVNPAQPTPKPATTASTNDLVATYGYDPFKLPPMPPQPSGEAARDWQKNAYKPLEGTAGQKVDGAKMYYNSLEKYNNYVSTLTATDLANPSVRSRLNSLYATAKLTGKEANNLGVLNGGDERILEEVLPNYKDITVTKKNLNRIVQDQKEFASGIIVEAYGTQQKVVPQNMRKFVVVPSTQEGKADTSVKNAPVQRAILNNEPIETRNNKWVYSKTGKAVE
jgi:hypothetical protein